MRIIAKNFLSWEKLDFEIPQGITLVQGFNYDDDSPEGSGKSAVLNSISWVVFGKIPKDAKIDDVIREGSKSCEVNILFDSGHVIRRTRKPNDLILIDPEGNEIKGKDSKETQKAIIDFVGISFETFCQSVYFAQNYANKFITSNQENKGKILSEIQELGQFDLARKNASERIKKLKPEILSLEKDLDKFESLLDSEKENKESIEKMIENFSKEKEKELKDLNSLLDSKEKELKETSTKFFELENEVSIISESALKDEKAYLSKNLKSLKNLENSKLAQMETVEAKKEEFGRLEKEISRLERDMHNKNSNLTFLFDKRISIKESMLELKNAAKEQEKVTKEKEALFQNPDPQPCPTCGQDWDGNTDHLEIELENENKKLSRLLIGIENHESELKKVDKEIEFNRNSLLDSEDLYKNLKEDHNNFEIPKNEVLESELKELRKDISVIENEEKSLEEKINNLKEMKMDLGYLKKSYEDKLEEISNLEMEISSKEGKEPSDLKSNLKKSDSKIKYLDKELKKSEKTLKEKKDLKNKIEILKDGYKEVKLYVFRSVLKELNRKANNYISELFEVPVSLKFESSDMKINLSVNFNGTERPIGLLSGGQFRRICLAVDLALSDITSNRKNCKIKALFLDEYFKDLSENSMEKILDLLKSREIPTIMIEHNSIFKSVINNTFNVELINGISKAA